MPGQLYFPANTKDALPGDSAEFSATSFWTDAAFKARFGTGRAYQYVIIHQTEGHKELDMAILTGPLSVHKYVTKNGERYHLLDDEFGAYGCGVRDPAHKTYLLGEVFSRNENLATLQIEIENFGYEDFTDPEYEAAAFWTAHWCRRYNIPVNRQHLLGHRELNKLKRDPSDKWNWDYFISLVMDCLADTCRT